MLKICNKCASANDLDICVCIYNYTHIDPSLMSNWSAQTQRLKQYTVSGAALWTWLRWDPRLQSRCQVGPQSHLRLRGSFQAHKDVARMHFLVA